MGPAVLSFSGDVVLSTGVPNAQALIGRELVGTVQLDNGSTFSSGPTQIGVGQSGIGFANVVGPRSTWTMGTTDVGFNGLGTLNILDGGVVDVTTGGLRIGTNSSGHGAVVVRGVGSTLLSRSFLNVGGQGVASLEISDGAIVNASQASGSTTMTIGRQSRVELDGGLLRTTNLINNGEISGSGELSGCRRSSPIVRQAGSCSATATTCESQEASSNRRSKTRAWSTSTAVSLRFSD